MSIREEKTYKALQQLFKEMGSSGGDKTLFEMLAELDADSLFHTLKTSIAAKLAGQMHGEEFIAFLRDFGYGEERLAVFSSVEETLRGLSMRDLLGVMKKAFSEDGKDEEVVN